MMRAEVIASLMRTMLVPCPSCSRHVKSGAARCPFCDGALDATARPDTAPDTRGWKRAAIFTFGAALTVAGCGSTTTGSGNDSGATDTSTMEAAADVSTDTTSDVATDVARDIANDEGGVAPPYGITPPDASFDAGDAAVDNGGIAPPYGFPPQDAGTDAGPPDDGSFKADYGAPPPRDAATG